jgi:hypothetical protein
MSFAQHPKRSVCAGKGAAQLVRREVLQCQHAQNFPARTCFGVHRPKLGLDSLPVLGHSHREQRIARQRPVQRDPSDEQAGLMLLGQVEVVPIVTQTSSMQSLRSLAHGALRGELGAEACEFAQAPAPRPRRPGALRRIRAARVSTSTPTVARSQVTPSRAGPAMQVASLFDGTVAPR